MESNLGQQSPQPVIPPMPVKIDNETSKPSPWIKIFLIILGLVVLVGIAGGSYYLGTKKTGTMNLNQQVKVSPTSMQPSQTPSPTPDPTANWQTYSPSDNSYSVKYPNDSNWKLTEVKGSYYADVDIQCPHVGCPQPYNVYDFAGGTATTLPSSIDGYLQSLNTTDPSINTHASPYIWDYQKIKIDGLDAVETLAQTRKLAGSGPIVTVFLVSKGHGYSFGYTYNDVALNTVTKLNQLLNPSPDIISTLKFTN